MFINPRPWLKSNIVPKEVICQVCGLIKEVNEMGQAVWPEKWALELLTLDVELTKYTNPKSGTDLCPECYYKEQSK